MKELRKNSLLNLKVCADLEAFCFGDNTFDIIVCWDTLEHLSKPDLVLKYFFKAVKPRGLLVLKMPNPLSYKGIATKFTPLWFHRVFHKYYLKSYLIDPTYGGPFKTYMKFSIHYKRILAMASGYQVGCLYSLNYTGRVYSRISRFLKVFSLGDIAFNMTDSVLVLRKGT